MRAAIVREWELRVDDIDRNIAAGAWDLDPLITGPVGIGGIPQAFDDLGRPDDHAKILVEPS